MTPVEEKAQSRVEAASAAGADTLDLSGLGLKALPELPQTLTSIKKVDLSRNRLRTLTAEFFSLAWLSEVEQLDLGANWLIDLPPQIGSLRALSKLDLSENQLTALPQELLACQELRELSLYSNRLTILPVVPGGELSDKRLGNLALLDISSNQLTSLAGLVALAPALRQLDASGNAIKALDEHLAELETLRILDLSRNQLASVELLAAMPWLAELYLDSNLIKSLPSAIAEFGGLRAFSAANNPFGALPPSFARVNAASFRMDAEALVSSHTSGGNVAGVEYFNAAGFSFDFLMALPGVAAVSRFVDLYFKNGSGSAATLRFPDGRVLELSNLSRKTVLALVEQSHDSIAAGKVLVQMPAAQQAGETKQFLVDAMARTPVAEILPTNQAQPVTIVVNGNFTQNLHQEINHVGDNISIGSNSGIINVKSWLENVNQTIGAAPGDETKKAEMTQALKNLADALAKTPDTHKLEAEAVSDAAAEVVAKATKEKPNKLSLNISAKGLLEAASAVAGVLPIAEQVVTSVLAFVGL